MPDDPHPDDCDCRDCLARRRQESIPPRQPPDRAPDPPPMNGQDPNKRPR